MTVEDPEAVAAGWSGCSTACSPGRRAAAVVLKDRSRARVRVAARASSRSRSPATTWCSRSTPSCRRSRSGALDDAIDNMEADGGDVVMLDPARGRSSRGRVAPRATARMRPSAFTETFEPGSLAKIFAAAALITLRPRAARRARVGRGGRYRLPDPRRHRRASAALAHARRRDSRVEQHRAREIRRAARARTSSTACCARSDSARRPASNFPPESPGTAAAAARVVASQLAPASRSDTSWRSRRCSWPRRTGAIANDGVLLQPTLIRECASPNGAVRYRHRARTGAPRRDAGGRRQVARPAARRRRGGRNRRAGARSPISSSLPRPAPRAASWRGRYAAGQYTASFAALFPADDPQLVVVMKIDNPQKGSYFAAQTAAPVTRSMLEQALAARTVALDRARLANVRLTADRARTAPLEEPDGVVPYVVSWPATSPIPPLAHAGSRRFPASRQAPLRMAPARCTGAGSRSSSKAGASVHHTWPARRGAMRTAGATVTMFARAAVTSSDEPRRFRKWSTRCARAPAVLVEAPKAARRCRRSPGLRQMPRRLERGMLFCAVRGAVHGRDTGSSRMPRRGAPRPRSSSHDQPVATSAGRGAQRPARRRGRRPKRGIGGRRRACR